MSAGHPEATRRAARIAVGRRSRQRARRAENGFWFAVVAVVSLIWLIPLVVVVLTAFKDQGQIFTGSPFALPTTWRFGNLRDAWRQANFSEYGLHSLIIALVKVPLGIALAALAAFGFSRFRFRFRNGLFFWLLLGSMIPVQIALIPMFDLLLRLNLIDTYVGLLLPYLAFGFPVEVFLLRAFFDQIPRELDEAARMDGASMFGLFFRVVLPLSIPILAALFILDFVATWNEFQIALVVLQTNDHYTLPLGLLDFQGHYSGNYTLMTSAVMMSAIPALVVYAIFQRYFIAGLTAGAIKG